MGSIGKKTSYYSILNSKGLPLSWITYNSLVIKSTFNENQNVLMHSREKLACKRLHTVGVCFNCFADYACQKLLLRATKHLTFKLASIKIALVKTVQYQREHLTGCVATERICHFLDPKPYRPLHLPPYVIPIARFLEKVVRKKTKQTSLIYRINSANVFLSIVPWSNSS